MTISRRPDEPVEPRFGPEDEAPARTLAFGLKESDRIVPARATRKPVPKVKPPARPQARSRAKPRAKPRAPTGDRRRSARFGGGGGGSGSSRSRGGGRRGSRRRRGVMAMLGRAVRRVVYWGVVSAVIVGGVGVATVAYYASQLPSVDQWTVPARAANVRILAANGALISNRGDTAGIRLGLEDLPPYLPEAVIAVEDRRFYWHFGIDPIGLTRAMVANFRAGRIVQGGSTVTQQLAKNLFLKPERTIARKVQEVILAVWLEAKLTKKEILELYLNRVYLGAGAFGVDAAAHRYFGKSARYVTLDEAATLAGLLKAPGTYSPIINPDAAAARTATVVRAMHDVGFISARETSLALSAETKIVADVAKGSGRYVVDWVLDRLPGFVGVPGQDIIVDTSIDLRLQDAAARVIAETLDELGPDKGVGQGALVAMDRQGAVRALVGGRDYAASPFNRAVDAHRQPGSAFKPFVYLTALENGLLPDSVRVDQPVAIGDWRPENYSKEYFGPVTLQTALALSLNTVSVQLTHEFGAPAVAATARRLGIASPLMETPSIALGTSEVTPLELTAAFVPFSNGGRGVIPHVIRRITTSEGEVLYQRTGSVPGQVIDPVQVGMMNAMLTDTLIRGTGRRAQIAGWPAAGKTGTSQDFRDAWFIGYTGVMTTGVWFGNDDARPTNRASGGNLPAIAWQRFMTEALEGLAVTDLPGNYLAGGDLAAAPTAGGVQSRQVVAPRPVAAIVGAAEGRPMEIVPQPQGLARNDFRAVPPSDDGWAVPLAGGTYAGAPLPPVEIGQQRQRRRRGFLSRLFGG